ncbi:MAG: hypothetical protein SGJ24_07935 [Chloroflexota bacterium]|nr:hypothetical protein [Chloroflexota bacterium]
MRSLDADILRTVLYADVFDFPLTAREIHHFLIADRSCTSIEVKRALAEPALDAQIAQVDDCVTLRGREWLVPLRANRQAAADALWREAVHYGAWLSRLPFVRMVAVTGALAMRNPSDERDDIDYVLVIVPGRVWLARLLAIAVVRIARLRGVTLCPNYVLSESALAQNRRDLFIAHEVTQMVPLYGCAVYHAMRASNAWVAHHLPNADGAFVRAAELRTRGLWGWVKRAGEALLGGRIGDTIEAWEYRRKQARFARQIKATSAARIDSDNVKGHFNDHGVRVLARYAESARAWGLDREQSEGARLPLAGD